MSDNLEKELFFIKNWDYEMYFFIHYLIQTDFKIFIDSNDDELLFHAIGFLFYSANNLYINRTINNYYYEDYLEIYESIDDYNIKKVKEIYEFIIKNKSERNIDSIKYIVSNHIINYGEFFKIKNFMTKIKICNPNINFNEQTINKIILNKSKLKKINEIIYKLDKEEYICDEEGIDVMMLNYFLNDSSENKNLLEDLNILINNN